MVRLVAHDRRRQPLTLCAAKLGSGGIEIEFVLRAWRLWLEQELHLRNEVRDPVACDGQVAQPAADRPTNASIAFRR